MLTYDNHFHVLVLDSRCSDRLVIRIGNWFHALLQDHGGIRLVAPSLFMWKSAKFLEVIYASNELFIDLKTLLCCAFISVNPFMKMRVFSRILLQCTCFVARQSSFCTKRSLDFGRDLAATSAVDGRTSMYGL